LLSVPTSSVDSAVEPSSTTTTSDLVLLVSLAIVRETHPEWTTATVATCAGELSISAERISRIKTKVMPRLTELVAAASQPGRRPFRRWAALA